MKKITVFIMIVFLSVSCSNQVLSIPETQYRGNSEHNGLYETTTSSSFDEVDWIFETGGAIRSTAVIADGVVYFTSLDGFVYAVNSADGSLVWKYNTGAPTASNVALDDGILYTVANDSDCLAIDIYTGEIIWEYKTESNLYESTWDFYDSSPMVYNNYVVFGGGDGYYYKLDKKSGKIKWKFDTSDITEPEFRKDLYLHPVPAYSSSTLFLASEDYLYAVNEKSGKEIWRFSIIGIQTNPTISGDKIYVGGASTELNAVDIETGEEVWNYRDKYGSWMPSTPVIYKNMAFTGSSDAEKVFAFDDNDGSVIWETAIHSRSFCGPTIIDDTLFVGCDNGKLLRVDPDSGDILSEFQVSGSIRTSAIYSNSRIFFGSDNGNLYSLK